MKKIYFGSDARKKIQHGVDMCCDVVKVSMGKEGKNVLIYNGQTTEIINDGVSIARQVIAKDNTDQAGIMLARQCAEKTNLEAGDGTTTTLVILQSLLNELLDDTQLMQPRVLRREIRKLTQEIVTNLEKKKTKVKNIEDIERVATTSSLNPSIGKIVAKVFNELGEDANITINETRRDILEYKIKDGIKFGSRNVALYSEEFEVYKDVPVAVFKEEVQSTDIVSKVEIAAKNEDKEVVIVAPQFSKDALALITQFKMKGALKVVAIENRDINVEDLIVFGNRMEKVIVTDEDTTFIGGNGDTKDYIKKLKKELKETESLYDRENLEKRISFLTGGIAEIIVGKPTDVEREEYVLKIEDAVHSARNAYQSGIVKGGGQALIEAAPVEGETITRDIMFRVCQVPYKQICENAEEDIEVGKEVVDSFKTISTSLINAVSTATSILTAESALIAYEDEQ